MTMKTNLKFFTALFVLFSTLSSYGQEIETLSGNHSGGYGAKTSKFTKIGGKYAHMAGLYGGWYINHKFMIGAEAAFLTNDIKVPQQYSAYPGTNMNYGYGQFGLMTEYVTASSKVFHIGFQLFSGTGYTTQYERKNSHDEYKNAKDTNWFLVTEPGVNVEINVLRWMRFCTGLSYRAAFGSDATGLKDNDINGTSLNLSLKFGKF
jgi:hypothetical protein